MRNGAIARACLGLVILAAVVQIAGPVGSASPAPTESGSFRLLRTIHFKNPVVDCHGSRAFDCVETSTVPESFDLGAATGPLDVSMTMTITYRTTAGDGASVIATMRPKVGGRLMAPGVLPIRPSTRVTTTTLRWTETGAPPDLYRLGFQIEHDGRSKLPMRVWAPKITLVIEGWVGGVH